jgi:cytochrome c2
VRFEWFVALSLVALHAQADEAAVARKRWAESPHGQLLERIIPPGFAPAMLPEPRSRGARLTQHYCVQCHNLANPAMHDGRRWPAVIERMLPRMEGKGNMGKLMAEMMVGVEAPSPEETEAIVAYHRRHALQALDAKRFPEVNGPGAESFRRACEQCHALPDPRMHTAKQWPGVVVRMQKNMQWMNRVVSLKPVPGEPQLKIEEINAFLIRHARR